MTLPGNPVPGTARGEFDGKVVLVTGAGRGIGRAVAVRLASPGSGVALTARTESELRAVADELVGASFVVPADLGAPGAPERVVAETEAELGPIDVLVNAAGVSPSYRRAEDTTIEDWDEVMGTNLRATFLVCQAAGRRMLERGSGSIVNVASIGGIVGLPRLVAYSAAKSALLGLTRVLAVEWAGRGVRVNAVAPGYVETEMTKGLIAHPKLGPELIASTPMGRLAAPEEIAEAVAYLASSGASYVTGAVLVIDGGWTAQ